jgi:hypothetical protein
MVRSPLYLFHMAKRGNFAGAFTLPPFYLLCLLYPSTYLLPLFWRLERFAFFQRGFCHSGMLEWCARVGINSVCLIAVAAGGRAWRDGQDGSVALAVLPGFKFYCVATVNDSSRAACA